ncbi:uncharacterized protein EI97DRAFT_72204 [Westerdykella ornata]|uniref:Uncharacterized protein n=1 Tax=Westerdykella ornata TaxID=318751 RepID=A0A6A6JI61_WESOR|nr:uncharacterized protein EI97DRAFT_72204 [Westerdykella ornata]KAF2275326.1 hypothetical protein EI97DRAFT_72204 [Westerdykella ornata]
MEGATFRVKGAKTYAPCLLRHRTNKHVHLLGGPAALLLLSPLEAILRSAQDQSEANAWPGVAIVLFLKRFEPPCGYRLRAIEGVDLEDMTTASKHQGLGYQAAIRNLV